VESTEKKYDMFISAHTRYTPRLIEPLLPGAEHVTVLREPASHFVSSWNYWGVAQHIRFVAIFTSHQQK
jgi:ribosomal protein S10